MVHNRILRPIYMAAIRDEELSSDMDPNLTYEACFRAYGPSKDPNDPPPPVIVRFCSKRVKNIVMRYKRENIPNPTAEEKAHNIKKIAIVEDITKDTHTALRNLKNDDRVLSAWTTNGRIF